MDTHSEAAVDSLRWPLWHLQSQYYISYDEYVVKIIFMWKTIQTIFAMGLGLQQLDCVSLNFEVEH